MSDPHLMNNSEFDKDGPVGLNALLQFNLVERNSALVPTVTGSIQHERVI